LGTKGILKALEQRVVNNNNPTFFSILQLSVNYGLPPTRPTRPTQLDIFSTSGFSQAQDLMVLVQILLSVNNNEVNISKLNIFR